MVFSRKYSSTNGIKSCVVAAVTEVAEHTGACDLRQSSSLGRAASESSSSRSGSGSGGLKYGSGDTLSDFVTFVCEETRKNQRLVRVPRNVFQ